MTTGGKKAWIFIAAAIIASGVLMAGGILHNVLGIRNMNIADIDISSVPDGTYRSSQDYLGFKCNAEVTVRRGAVTGIMLTEDRSDEWVEKAKGVGQRVIDKQSLKVDAVTGATITSKAMLKAIENALKGQGARVKGQEGN